MADYTYADLFIDDDDLSLDDGYEPRLVYDLDVITQDIKHLIRESGLLIEMIGERSAAQIEAKRLQLVLLIEEDQRLVPGTIDIERLDHETFLITGQTYQFGDFQLQAG